MVRTPSAVATMISSPSWRASRDFLAPLASTTVAEEGKQGSPSPRSADGGGKAETVGDGVEAETVGGVTTASTVTETPLTLANMEVVLFWVLVALTIADCTKVAVVVGVRILTSTMTLPDVTSTVTDDG